MVNSKLKTEDIADRYEYQIDGAGQVLFNVKRTAAHFIVDITANTNIDLEMRFGVAYKSREAGWGDTDWHLPSDNIKLPPDAVIKDGSVELLLLKGEQRIEFPLEGAPLGIKFALKEQGTENWFNNNNNCNNYYQPVNDVYHNIPIHLRYAFREILDDMEFEGFQKDNAWEYSPEWFGFSNWVQDSDRLPILKKLNDEFVKRNLLLEAVLSGSQIVVVKKGVCKRIALNHFCLKYNLNPERVAGFGDQPDDIDKDLCNKPLQGHILIKNHAKAGEIEEVLDNLNEDEIDAYVFDYDGVVQGFYEDYGNIKALKFIMKKIRAGKPVAIITSRPEGEAKLILQQLRDHGFGEQADDYKYFTMYTNKGARLMLEGEY
ncbi:HAD hydrolase family protein [Candidatus Margulisiibacteriota bacterium]